MTTLPPDSGLSPRLLKRWVELDLWAAAEAGELSRAYEQSASVQSLGNLLDQGQSLILTGKVGIGKTALVHELAVRAHQGRREPKVLVGKRVLQLSFQRCLSLVGPEELPAAFRELREFLEQAEGVLPFFSDFDLVFHHDLETQVQEFCDSYSEVILGEGSPRITRAILEYFPELRRTFRPLALKEPSSRHTRRILAAWAEREGRFSEGALEEALYLSQRFLPRQHQPRKALELLAGTALSARAKSTLEAEDVIDRFCQGHGAPPWALDPREGPVDEDYSRETARGLGRPRHSARWPDRSEQ